MTKTFPSAWIITIDDVVIPQSEYSWTDDGNFQFTKNLSQLAQEYCSIHKNYEEGDKITVCMKMQWEVEL